MNRRHFLGSLAALSAGMALDPERALWIPGRKTYFDIVAPKIQRCSKLVIESRDGRSIATMSLAHDFGIELGQAISVSMTDGTSKAARIMSGFVIGIDNAIAPAGMRFSSAPATWTVPVESTRDFTLRRALLPAL